MPRPRKENQLELAAVAAAARQVFDASGLAGTTMRRVAETLGVDASSLYWHVRNKDELLDLIADELLRDLPLPDRSLPWRTRLERLLTGYRKWLLRNPDAARLLAGRLVLGPNTLRVLEFICGSLLSAGLKPEAAAQSSHLVVAYVLGFVLQEIGPMNAAEARGAVPETVLAETAAVLRSLPPEEFPSVVALAEHLVAPTMDERFDRGLRALLGGLAVEDS
ncbi:TetR/AcrR family transcriptional regulator [Nocardia arthritidis]|uniref:TetR family transcriptional regulator n=1 Tax=Nocardia arthritidis TaxID=228602 RepID=A0A6G9Y911_9NOCA|nr:TetR/AcrR family transcriptional regulator [Nocardia arthritidis]QIS09634.1 TetR family transcriptional regulator [Nocardia arthritidis]